MYKDFHNKIQNLPQGTPAHPWVNLFWLLVFSPFFVLLAAFVVAALWAIGQFAFEALFG
ncbi:MAG: hypothetical protein K8I27_03240 [Planctomycetes bacterium]|nr:hypothetical protein [Planctomycetota bacterium]